MIARLAGALVTVVAVPTVSFLFWTIQIEDGPWDLDAAEKPTVPARLVAYLEETFIDFDLGRSSFLGALPVSQVIREGLPVDVVLLCGSIALGVTVGLAAGLTCVRDGRFAPLLRWLAAVGLSAPVYATGLGILYFLPELQASGSLWAPIVVAALPLAATVARMTEATAREVVGDHCVRTARAKGVPERAILRRHALPVAAAPVVALVGSGMGLLVLNLALVEAAFNVNGSFRDVLRAVNHLDLPLLQGMVLVTTVLVVAGNLAADLVLAWLRRGTQSSRQAVVLG